VADQNQQTQMPKWLLYGLAVKAALIIVVVLLLWYAGVFR
jgi:hypothetical protein